jgi:hypothetical protein
MRRPVGLAIVAAMLLAGGYFAAGMGGPAPEVMAAEADAKVSYAKDIQPLLQAKCYECHNARRRKAGVDLQSGYAGVLRIVKPEKPEDSRLFKCLIGKGAKPMPPKNPLPEDKVNMVKAWIAAGAKQN